MFFQINPHNGVPIYEQISRQVKFAIAAKSLRPGERVPSVRELASHIAVNPNTVSKAYRDLVGEGILESLRGEGLEVTAKAPPHCQSERARLVSERFSQVIQEAQQSGLTNREIKQIVHQLIQESIDA